MKNLVASAALVMVLAVVGCGPGLASAPSASPAPSPAPQGVLVDLLSETDHYAASLVALDGSVTRKIVAAKRTPIATAAGHAAELPYVSTSLSTLYFLDGDSSVRALRSDGTMPEVAKLLVGPNQEATFAVSPENNRIAVGVLDFSRAEVHVSLYTDALRGGERKVIFESDTNYVWPVAWHLGRLVLAHAYGPYRESLTAAGPGQANPYSAISYHIVDPADASRVALLGQCTVSGPLSPAGTACIQGDTLGWEGGEGHNWGTSNWGSISAYGSLSPTGEFVVATVPYDQGLFGLWRTDNILVKSTVGPKTPYWGGWLDSNHVLTGSAVDPSVHPLLIRFDGGPMIVVATKGFYAARLPTDVS